MLPFNANWVDEELSLFASSINRFLDKEVDPYYSQWEEDRLTPKALWRKLGEAGLLCVDIAENYGGAGADFRHSAMIGECLFKRGFYSIGGGIGVHSDIVSHYIANLGTELQKRNILPAMASGELVGALAMTEPGAGSDLKAIRTHAKKVTGGWVINGAKTFISNGQHCDIAVVACKTDPAAGAKGVSLFICNAADKGFDKGKKLNKIGLQCQDTSELFFNDMFVADDALLGHEGQGFTAMMAELPRERLILALGAQAAAEGILEHTLEYVRDRKAFNQRIADFQNTRFKLAEMATRIRVQKAFIDQCVLMLVEKRLDAETAAMAKLHATELQFDIAHACLQLYGGYGYMSEYRMSRDFVDARIQSIYGGTSEIMKEIISRKLIG